MNIYIWIYEYKIVKAPQQKILLLDYNILERLCTLVNSTDQNIKKNAFTCISITTELGKIKI